MICLTTILRSLSISTTILLIFSSCVANRPYRMVGVSGGVYERKFPGQKMPTELLRADENNRYRVSFVEFDEKGDFWDREQLAIAASAIKHSPRPVLLVVFIHGWHHNAADRTDTENPGDVQTFKCLLSQLAVSESTRGLDVHGVYLGWRGRLIHGPLDYFTFLGRKAAAARVAGTPVTETIFELIRQARRRAPNASKTVVIGHSFGALVLEKAMAQAVAGSILSQDAQRSGGTFNAPADLILLVNSAAESLNAKELSDMFRGIGHRGHINANRPLLVSLTSKSDTATSAWFRGGTFLPNLLAWRHYDWDFERRGPTSAGVSQHEYLTTTPGHQERLFTHDVILLGSDPLATTSTPYDIRQPEACVRQNPAFEENLRHPHGMMFATSRRDRPEQLDWWSIVPRSDRRPSPYWIMQVPDKIIHGHTPIFTPEARAMMAAIFRITNPKTQPGPRQMRLE